MVRIKFCGLINVEDTLGAIEVGADMLGFNFYPPSSRYITPSECAEIVSEIAGELARADRDIQLVGVFVNHPLTEIRSIVEECGLDLAQLSGDEIPHMVEALGERAFKGFRSDGRTALADAARRYPRRNFPPAFLVDAGVRGQYGGTGTVADWQQAAEAARHFPILLAGGLHPGNVVRAIKQVQPWGVDVASGIESGPGRKDIRLMTEFVKQVREIVDQEAG